MKTHFCRFCGAQLQHVFADLGATPLANSFLEESELSSPEPIFPLRALVCDRCFLVQLPEHESAKAIFSDYAYFSSYSDTWLEHARAYCLLVTERFGLDAESRVIEIASNDGYLLKNFVEHGIPVLGIEPAANVAAAAEKLGVPTRVQFFGRKTATQLAAEGVRADLLLGNNVFAHVPDLEDFVSGMPLVLEPHGVLTLEFPHLLRLIEGNQFDTIYHEHFSYFSFAAACNVLASQGLTVFDVQELPTHGGSLRIFAQHDEAGVHPEEPRIGELLERERERGLGSLDAYLDFEVRVRETKTRFVDFLARLKSDGRTIVGYGAPAKGNTLLNYCGLGRESIDYTVDRSPHKQGRFLPGSRIPIHAPERIFETRPDYVLILPWNLKDEIARDLTAVREWGGKLFVAIPEIQVLD